MSKKKTEEERLIEAEGATIFGKHVSKEKGRGLLVASLLACALPMVLGALGAMMWAVNDRASRVEMPAPDNTFGIYHTAESGT